ncbi:cysteine proteinase [Acephala macrosclerotiorum]|nr:cysteine proteinase [Acephala macrosclerotiorum]
MSANAEGSTGNAAASVNSSGTPAASSASPARASESRGELFGRAWLDIESEPKVFQEIVCTLGATGINVQELYGLDDEIAGLIFLFNYRAVDGQEKDEAQDCPKHVWFANQTTNNACATVALLNILMNIPDLQVRANGVDHLRTFKASTIGLTPAERGQELTKSESIRRIHNSSTRSIEALNAALALQNEVDEWKKAKRYRKKAPTKAKRTSKGKAKKVEDDAFHYIAYVPIQGEVWRLDGLLRQPVNLGNFEGDWTALAQTNIQQRMAEEHDIDFNLMAICINEEQTILQQCLKNAISIEKIKVHARSTPELTQYWKSDEPKPMQAHELHHTFGITQEQLQNNDKLADCTLAFLTPENELEMLRSLVGEQNELKGRYLEQTINDGPEDVVMGEDMEESDTDATREILQALLDAGVELPGVAKK